MKYNIKRKAILYLAKVLNKVGAINDEEYENFTDINLPLFELTATLDTKINAELNTETTKEIE